MFFFLTSSGRQDIQMQKAICVNQSNVGDYSGYKINLKIKAAFASKKKKQVTKIKLAIKGFQHPFENIQIAKPL